MVLAVDRASTKALYTEFTGDLDRLRAGRRDPMHEIARRLLTDGVDERTLGRLTVVPVDVDRPSDPEARSAFADLETVLVDPAQTAVAWAVLAEVDRPPIEAAHETRLAHPRSALHQRPRRVPVAHDLASYELQLRAAADEETHRPRGVVGRVERLLEERIVA